MNLNLIGKKHTHIYKQLPQSTVKTCKQADKKMDKICRPFYLDDNVIYMYLNVKDGYYRSFKYYFIIQK